MNTSLKARILAQAAETPSLTRKQGQKIAALLVVASIAVALALFHAFGGLLHSRDRPLSSTIKLADGWGLVSSAITWLVVGRGRSTLARSPPVLVAVTAACPVLLLAWMRQFDGWVMADEHADIACLFMTLSIAAMPLASFLWLRRGAEPKHPAALGAAAGAMSGAWAALFVLLWCPVTDTLHALVGHVFPVVLLIAIGATFGGTTLARHE